MVTHVEPCSTAERELFAQLYSALERAQRDVQIAFTVFCHARGLPAASELEGVTMNGLLVKAPSVETPSG